MIRWSDSMSVGYDGIDEQHKKLIDIIEDVAYIVKEKDNGFTNLMEVLGELDAYVAEHFAYEEALMKQHAYPEAEAHIKQHDDLRDKLEQLNIFDIDKPIEFFKDLLVYLVDWLSRHIMLTDMKLGAYLT